MSAQHAPSRTAAFAGAISLLRPLAGLPGTEYALAEVDAGLFTLTAADAAGRAAETISPPARLFVVSGAALPVYQPELDDAQIAALELSAADDAVVFVVVNPADGAPTLNLLAPIIVNRHTRRAAQFVLDAARWPLRASLDEVLAS